MAFCSIECGPSYLIRYAVVSILHSFIDCEPQLQVTLKDLDALGVVVNMNVLMSL
jgi:hypothetical protein